jgi:hypothetical protein
MLYAVRQFFAIFCLMASVSAYASGLTEESVKQLISRVNNAVNKLNAQEVASVLAENVKVTVHIRTKGSSQVMNLSKQEYLAALQQGWAMSTNYKYARTNTVIKIQGEKALVSSLVKESMMVQGQSVSGNSKEEVTIELVRGKPLVTNVTAYTSM